MKRFTARGANRGFTCFNCGAEVPPLANGGCRNHCPYCLYSLHVDIHPGDRASGCLGVLEPIGVEHHPKKGWVIVSRCLGCGVIRRNRAALDDPHRPDSFAVIVELSKTPLG